MKIIDILKQRSEDAIDEVKIELKLYNLAHDLEKKSRAHLKRIITVLTEFDIHDEKHSEKVIENIEKLLGDEMLRSLSTYELFLLHLSAFFHDCAMAPSDWEINTMKLTEGSEKYFQDEFSIKYDLKTPLKFLSAKQIIIANKNNLYRRYESDVKDWMFVQSTEESLVDYLSSLLIEYQNYRNGFSDKLKRVGSQAEFNELNNFIRIDYIRATHHTRIETYVKNLESIFGQAFEQPAWGKKLVKDLSLICRSHGEDSAFISSFSSNAQYYGSDSANLQFIAIMLRLGDIIHFSYDRAPIDMRTSKLFKSEYSFQQWAIKNNGVNYSIDNGEISFRAYCVDPETYFKLHEYLDWIEIEIQNYFKFQRQWSKNYIHNLQDKVERSNIINDDESFLPRRGLSFSLNQKKILNLLMGVGLYKDKYACLRELYQNSLDAVRCALSNNEINGSHVRGMIEFSIIKDEGKTYLCCIDNGIGMTKDVIENYLLKIGNSYYKSSDFYKQQANWGGKFTPTSQFGIGILSCFMIGDKIEITTRYLNGDYISCAINGPHENFYYKKTSLSDKELIPISGTIVKVLLNDETVGQINNEKINKIGLLLLGLKNALPNEFKKYLKYKKNWENHLFKKINHFVQIPPQNIDVFVGINDGSKLSVLAKPILIDFENVNLEIEEDDFDFVDYLNNSGRFNPLPHRYTDVKDFIETYKLVIQFENTEYVTTITLPKKEFIFENIGALYSMPKIGEVGTCIDGIYVEKDNISLENYYTNALSRNGVINFLGELRPQLSVDRTSIVDYPKKSETIAEEISKLLIERVLDVTTSHISKYNFEANSNVFNLIWEYIFEKLGFADNLFINEFSFTECGNIKWRGLNEKLHEPKSIREFVISDSIKIQDFNLSGIDILTKKLFLTKLISASEIFVEDSNIHIVQKELLTSGLIKKRNSFSDHDLLIVSDSWEIFDKNFDIVSNLYPLVPKRLHELIDNEYAQKANSRIKVIHSYSNGLTSFFSQNPLLIHQKLGLYMEESNAFGDLKNYIYNFEKKRSKIRLFELNDRFTTLKSKEKYVLLVYVNPKKLSEDEDKELNKYLETDPSYVRGVSEGWSLLITSMDIDNIIIFPGKTNRENLVSLVSNEFWEAYKDFTFKFTDNTVMEKLNM